jgi:hypothetical protein
MFVEVTRVVNGCLACLRWRVQMLAGDSRHAHPLPHNGHVWEHGNPGEARLCVMTAGSF